LTSLDRGMDYPRPLAGIRAIYWGPRNYTGEIVIVLGSSNPDNDRKFFQSVEVKEQLDNPYSLPFERRPILLCRGLKENLQSFWSRVKNWD